MLPTFDCNDYSHIPTDYLLVVAIEECAELQKTLTKMFRFGPTDENVERHRQETFDLIASIHMLTNRLVELGKIDPTFSIEEGADLVVQKVNKVVEFYDRTNGGNAEPTAAV